MSGRVLGFLSVALLAAVVLLPRRFWILASLVVAVIAVLVVVVSVARFAIAPAAVKRNYPAAWWARIRWRWLARNLGLARKDIHQLDKRQRKDDGRPQKVRHLRARFRPTSHGVTATIRTTPGSGRAEVEAAADHLANAWRCRRVSVFQPAPGRLIVRGLKRDPLAEVLDVGSVPAGVYDHPDVARPYLGLDEHAQHRYLSLANTTGLVIGGLPGRGKSVLINSLICQWAGSRSVALVCLDGKGSCDLEEWRGRAWLMAGDDLEAAVSVLEDCHLVMRQRLASIRQLSGSANAWRSGPTESLPLLVVVLDECQVYLDSAAVKGRKPDEDLVRRCQSLTAELVRRGRSALVFTIMATQKATTDSLPSSIRDNAGLSLCFGVKTAEASAAVLGASIREHPTFSPVGLQDDAYAGVVTTTLATGHDPFTRVRIPDVTEAMVEARAAATAVLRVVPGLGAQREQVTV